MKDYNKIPQSLLFKFICALLIQAFLVMDFAWAGGENFLHSKPDNIQSTLAPKIIINNNLLVDIYNDAYLKQKERGKIIPLSPKRPIFPTLEDIFGHIIEKAGLENVVQIIVDDFEVEYGQYAICELWEDGTLAIHPEFETDFTHIQDAGINFDYKFDDGIKRKIHLAESIAYRVAMHEFKLAGRDGHGHGYLDEEGNFQLSYDETEANIVGRRYSVVDDAIWLWYLHSYRISDQVRYDNKKFRQRIDWIFNDPSYYAQAARAEFPSLVENKQKREEAIKLALLVNKAFFIERRKEGKATQPLHEKQNQKIKKSAGLKLQQSVFATGKERLPEDIVEVPRVRYALKPERELTERVNEQRAAVEIQKEISYLIAELFAIDADARNAKTDEEKQDIQKRTNMLIEQTRALYTNMPAVVIAKKSFEFYSSNLKALKERRIYLYEKIESADARNDKNALKNLNLELIRNNNLIAKLQILVSGMFLKAKADIKSISFQRGAALASLQGALNSTKMLEDELIYRAQRLRARKKIQEIQTTDWMGELISTFRLGGFDIEVSSDKDEPTVWVRQQRWINVRTSLINIRRDVKRGNIKKALDKIDTLIKLYDLRYITTLERYKTIQADLKNIKQVLLNLPEAQAPPKELIKELSEQIKTLFKNISHPKVRIWTDIEFQNLGKALRGQIKKVSSYAPEYTLILKNKANLEYYSEKLRIAEEKHGISQREKTMILNGLMRMSGWFSRGFVDPKQLAAIDIQPALTFLDADNYRDALGYLNKLIRHLDNRLKEIDGITVHTKRSANSMYIEFRDADIKRRADTIINKAADKNFEDALSQVKELRELYFNHELVEPGYIRAETVLRGVQNLMRGAIGMKNPEPNILEMRKRLSQLKDDIEHKYSFRVHVIQEEGSQKHYYVPPGTTAAGIMQILKRNPEDTQISIGKKWITKSRLKKVKLTDRTLIVLKPRGRSVYAGGGGKLQKSGPWAEIAKNIRFGEYDFEVIDHYIKGGFQVAKPLMYNEKIGQNDKEIEDKESRKLYEDVWQALKSKQMDISGDIYFKIAKNAGAVIQNEGNMIFRRRDTIFTDKQMLEELINWSESNGRNRLSLLSSLLYLGVSNAAVHERESKERVLYKRKLTEQPYIIRKSHYAEYLDEIKAVNAEITAYNSLKNREKKEIEEWIEDWLNKYKSDPVFKKVAVDMKKFIQLAEDLDHSKKKIAEFVQQRSPLFANIEEDRRLALSIVNKEINAIKNRNKTEKVAFKNNAENRASLLKDVKLKRLIVDYYLKNEVEKSFPIDNPDNFVEIPLLEKEILDIVLGDENKKIPTRVLVNQLNSHFLNKGYVRFDFYDVYSRRDRFDADGDWRKADEQDAEQAAREKIKKEIDNDWPESMKKDLARVIEKYTYEDEQTGKFQFEKDKALKSEESKRFKSAYRNITEALTEKELELAVDELNKRSLYENRLGNTFELIGALMLKMLNPQIKYYYQYKMLFEDPQERKKKLRYPDFVYKKDGALHIIDAKLGGTESMRNNIKKTRFKYGKAIKLADDFESLAPIGFLLLHDDKKISAEFEEEQAVFITSNSFQDKINNEVINTYNKIAQAMQKTHLGKVHNGKRNFNNIRLDKVQAYLRGIIKQIGFLEKDLKNDDYEAINRLLQYIYEYLEEEVNSKEEGIIFEEFKEKMTYLGTKIEPVDKDICYLPDEKQYETKELPEKQKSGKSNGNGKEASSSSEKTDKLSSTAVPTHSKAKNIIPDYLDEDNLEEVLGKAAEQLGERLKQRNFISLEGLLFETADFQKEIKEALITQEIDEEEREEIRKRFMQIINENSDVKAAKLINSLESFIMLTDYRVIARFIELRLEFQKQNPNSTILWKNLVEDNLPIGHMLLMVMIMRLEFNLGIMGKEFQKMEMVFDPFLETNSYDREHYKPSAANRLISALSLLSYLRSSSLAQKEVGLYEVFKSYVLNEDMSVEALNKAKDSKYSKEDLEYLLIRSITDITELGRSCTSSDILFFSRFNTEMFLSELNSCLWIDNEDEKLVEHFKWFIREELPRQKDALQIAGKAIAHFEAFDFDDLFKKKVFFKERIKKFLFLLEKQLTRKEMEYFKEGLDSWDEETASDETIRHSYVDNLILGCLPAPRVSDVNMDLKKIQYKKQYIDEIKKFKHSSSLMLMLSSLKGIILSRNPNKEVDNYHIKMQIKILIDEFTRNPELVFYVFLKYGEKIRVDFKNHEAFEMLRKKIISLIKRDKNGLVEQLLQKGLIKTNFLLQLFPKESNFQIEDYIDVVIALSNHIKSDDPRVIMAIINLFDPKSLLENTKGIKPHLDHLLGIVLKVNGFAAYEKVKYIMGAIAYRFAADKKAIADLDKSFWDISFKTMTELKNINFIEINKFKIRSYFNSLLFNPSEEKIKAYLEDMSDKIINKIQQSVEDKRKTGDMTTTEGLILYALDLCNELYIDDPENKLDVAKEALNSETLRKLMGSIVRNPKASDVKKLPATLLGEEDIELIASNFDGLLLSKEEWEKFFADLNIRIKEKILQEEQEKQSQTMSNKETEVSVSKEQEEEPVADTPSEQSFKIIIEDFDSGKELTNLYSVLGIESKEVTKEQAQQILEKIKARYTKQGYYNRVVALVEELDGSFGIIVEKNDLFEKVDYLFNDDIIDEIKTKVASLGKRESQNEIKELLRKRCKQDDLNYPNSVTERIGGIAGKIDKNIRDKSLTQNLELTYDSLKSWLIALAEKSLAEEYDPITETEESSFVAETFIPETEYIEGPGTQRYDEQSVVLQTPIKSKEQYQLSTSALLLEQAI